MMVKYNRMKKGQNKFIKYSSLLNLVQECLTARIVLSCFLILNLNLSHIKLESTF